MANKVLIELRPYDAITIMAFLQEYINEDTKSMKGFQPINEAVDAFAKEVCKNMTEEQISDAALESDINNLTKRHPQKK